MISTVSKVKKNTCIADVGKTDINFPEFCFGVIGKKTIKNEPNFLVYEDPNYPDRKITIVRSAYGLPNQSTRDLILALLRITWQKNNFTSRIVPITASEVLEALGVAKSGRSLNVLRKNLDILQSTSIKFENNFFLKKNNKNISDELAFSVLSSYYLKRVKTQDKDNSIIRDNPDCINGYFVWEDTFFASSLENAKNLIDYNYTLFFSLRKDISKQLYHFLQKRGYNKNVLRIDLRVLAFQKLGISQNHINKIYKVRQLLKDAHKELLKIGFLSELPKFDKHSKTKEYVVYTFQSNPTTFQLQKQKPESELALQDSQKREDCRSRLLNLSLTDGQAGKIFRNYSLVEIQKALELIQFYYPEGEKIKKPMALVVTALKGQLDTTSLDKDKQEKKIEKKRSEQEKQAQEKANYEKELLEKAREIEAKRRLEKLRIWKEKHAREYLSEKQFFLDNLNRILKTALEKKAREKKVKALEIVDTNKMTKGMFRTYLWQKYFQSDLLF